MTSGSERRATGGGGASPRAPRPGSDALAERGRERRRIYLNAAATSYPKPPEVVAAVQEALAAPPRDRDRGGAGEDPRLPCRRELAALFGVEDPQRVVLLPSATHALNLVIGGLLTYGSHVVTTPLEHNSVLRPLAHLARDRDVSATLVRPDWEGRISVAAVAAALGTGTRLVVVTHASNVSGSIQPVEEIAVVAADAGVPLLVDAAQSAGAVPIRHDALPGRVFIAFSGHKGLLGPPGVGGLIVPDAETPQDVVGGTGALSESVLHPERLPLRHEAGTPNFPGIAGLCAGVRLLARRGVAREGAARAALVAALTSRLAALPAVRPVPIAGGDARAGILSFNLDGWSPDDLAFALREAFGIEVRAGLQCAPLAHRCFGTAPRGTVRASFGAGSDERDVTALAEALEELASV